LYGLEEITIEHYLDSDIPDHWVEYIRHFQTYKILWDRRDYTDLLDDIDLFL